jgi:dTDP-glucose pyrophosphorylase/CBS domain-containing protein
VKRRIVGFLPSSASECGDSMINWKDILISPETSILKAIEIIDAGAKQIAVVVDENCFLLGTVTDGDIRRGILKGIAFDNPVQQIMNRHPVVAGLNDGRENILAVMKLKDLRNMPVVDEHGRVVGVEFLNELIRPQLRDNWVVLMAGGLGSRLHPLTESCPKPLIHVGNKPILETILENFVEYGFRRFYISVNYMAEMVEDYFGDGAKWGVDIRFIREDTALGTAGPLGILPEKPVLPLLVMNGDLLTKVNFQQLLDFHQAHRSNATMCVREYDFTIPYGVARMEKHRLLDVEEKPVQRYFVNAGIYVLEPDTLELIPPGRYLDMPDFFKSLIASGFETSAFPLREYWLDIGRIDDLERAKGEYAEAFK